MRNVSFHTIASIYKGFNFEISYLIRPSHGETILYLHGLGSTKYDFIEATNQDSLRDFTIVAFDLPGSGNSNYIEGTTVDDLVELTNEVVTQEELGGALKEPCRSQAYDRGRSDFTVDIGQIWQ